MVRHRAGERWRALDGIEAAHRLFPLPDSALVGELARIAQGGWSIRQKISLQGKDDVGLIQAVVCRQFLPKGEPGSGPCCIRACWFVLMPFCLWEALQY